MEDYEKSQTGLLGDLTKAVSIRDTNKKNKKVLKGPSGKKISVTPELVYEERDPFDKFEDPIISEFRA